MQPAVSATFDRDAKPTVQHRSDALIVNAAFTFPEIIFGAFVAGNLMAAVSNGSNLIFLGYKNVELKQAEFDKFVKSNFPLALLRDDFSILPLIQSIWQKTRNCIDNKVTLLTPTEFNDENKWVEKAKKYESDMLVDGARGKMMTARQVVFLLDSIKLVEKKGAKICKASAAKPKGTTP